MYIRTIKLEKAGLKEYWTEERLTQETNRKEWWNSVLPFNLYTIEDPESDADEEMFEGGSRRKKKMEIGEEGASPGYRRKTKKATEKLSFIQMMSGASVSNLNESPWHQMDAEEKKVRIKFLWDKARRYNNKLRLQARLQKMAEQNLREMMIDDIQDDDEENQVVETRQNKVKWYLIDTDRNFCKFWNFIITILTIYNLLVTPLILIFPSLYMMCVMPEGQEQTEAEKELYICPDGEYQSVNPTHRNLKTIEYIIDVFYMLEILFCFLKVTMAHKDIKTIAKNYITGAFVFDVIATIPNLIFFREGLAFYWLKIFRFRHIYRLQIPQQMLMKIALRKYSKKRQNDIISFTTLICSVIYTGHIGACIWLWLGNMYDCANVAEGEFCIQSWRYQDDFKDKSIATLYIFSFYWIFEVITTVGYGDYVGKTSEEYIFSIVLEFIGLTFFSFLMGSINSIFNLKDNFEDLIEEKLDSLDMWIKKIEKSNKPYHIQPTLYNDIRRYVEQAFMYDFNLVIEEFQFYQQITPKMQTELIQSTRTFKEFEKSFNHFFEECERGFTNELIINMLCRIYTPGKNVIGYKNNVKEMYFIRQGLVEVFNNVNDDKELASQKGSKQRPILYLPKFSYFGDFQILFNLKSNLEYRTLENIVDDKNKAYQESLPDILFMCVEKERLLDLCDLFPQTAENIKVRARERRIRFMQQKNTNSKRYDEKMRIRKEMTGTTEECGDDIAAEWYSDEEADNTTNQKEDMKVFLNKLNGRIDTLVDALKKADTMIVKQKDQQTMLEQIKERRAGREAESASIAQAFMDEVAK